MYRKGRAAHQGIHNLRSVYHDWPLLNTKVARESERAGERCSALPSYALPVATGFPACILDKAAAPGPGRLRHGAHLGVGLREVCTDAGYVNDTGISMGHMRQAGLSH